MRLDYKRCSVCYILYYFLLLALRIYYQSFLLITMKATTVVLLLALVIIGIASAQTNCSPPTVNGQVIPVKSIYKHGDVSGYYLLCMNGEWEQGISSPILACTSFLLFIV